MGQGLQYGQYFVGGDIPGSTFLNGIGYNMRCPFVLHIGERPNFAEYSYVRISGRSIASDGAAPWVYIIWGTYYE